MKEFQSVNIENHNNDSFKKYKAFNNRYTNKYICYNFTICAFSDKIIREIKYWVVWAEIPEVNAQMEV